MQQAPGSLSSYSLLERQELTAHSMPEFATFPGRSAAPGHRQTIEAGGRPWNVHKMVLDVRAS
jgi:hypothetical protein